MPENMLRHNDEVKNGLDGKICKDFEAYTLPMLVLIGPAGEVVASGLELHGRKLESVLRSLR